MSTVARMARKLRVEYPGALYHLMSRGDRREPVFHDDPDRELFLATLGEACQKAVWEVHAFCLMPNHFHLVIETPQGGLVARRQWLLGTYTGRVNRRHKLGGHLFSGRYKALIVDGSGDDYLKTVCDYVHLNPARARLMAVEEPLRVYRWSSFPEYLKPPSKRVAWRSGQGAAGAAVAGGYAGDAGVDCRSAANGQRGLSEQPAVLLRKGRLK